MRFDQFEQAARGKTLRPQIWARFSQPCRILYTACDRIHGRVINALCAAVETFHRRSLSLLPDNATPRDIWLRGLRETYASEWRSEKAGRLENLYEAEKASFEKRTQAVLAYGNLKPGCRSYVRMTASLRRYLAKAACFLQLMKASVTFDGGVDYALWKIKRQSGVEVHASDFQRRYPLIAAWPLLWQVVRKGGLK